MKKTVKMLSLVLAAILAAACLFGCGTSVDGNQVQEVDTSATSRSESESTDKTLESLNETFGRGESVSKKEEYLFFQDGECVIYSIPDEGSMFTFQMAPYVDEYRDDAGSPDTYAEFIESCQIMADNVGKTLDEIIVSPHLFWQEGYALYYCDIIVTNFSSEALNLDNVMRARLVIADEDGNETEILGDISISGLTANHGNLKNVLADNLESYVNLCFNVPAEYYETVNFDLKNHPEYGTYYFLKEGYHYIIKLDVKDDPSQYDSPFSESDSYRTYYRERYSSREAIIENLRILGELE